MTIVTPPPAVDRDRWGRPLVVPPGGGRKVAYTRATTYIDCIEDKFNLQKWMQRMVALGLAARPDLLLSVSAHKDDKRELDKICDNAREAAASSAAATTGTAIHALTEIIDRGGELPPLPADAVADLDAYKAATADLRCVEIERFCVLDALKIGGTPDRIVEYQGERYIADVKTGSIEYGIVKIAAQLAIYARSWLYDIPTGQRSAHGASVNRGIIIHVPAGTGTAALHWVDLEAGWEAVKVATLVREQRALKFADLTEPFGPAARPSMRQQHLAEAKQQQAVTNEAELLERMIRACGTADAVRALWADNANTWNDHLTEVAKQHIASLPAAAS